MTQTQLEIAKSRLIAAIRVVAPAKAAQINQLKKAAANWSEPDFVWEALLISMATMGNSRGAALVKDETHHSQVRYSVLERLPPSQRLAVLRRVLREARVRMSERKAAWLDENFARIASEGGPESVKRSLAATKGRKAKIAFLKTFTGIGDKYARNLMMDVYHPEFRDSIAIDERIKRVSDALGIGFPNYAAAEAFYLDVAHAGGLEGWELDRLLYNYLNEVVEELNRPAAGPGQDTARV